MIRCPSIAIATIDRADELASMGYTLERELLPDCSATEYGLLMLRLQLAPQIVSVLEPDDHPLLGPLRRLLFAGGTSDTLQAVVAQRLE